MKSKKPKKKKEKAKSDSNNPKSEEIKPKRIYSSACPMQEDLYSQFYT